MEIKSTLLEKYKEKLCTADEAAGAVKSGDWIFIGQFAMQAKDMDAALARRAEELSDVKVRGTCLTMVPEIIKNDPERRHFQYNDWHFSAISRALHKKDLCNYMPLLFHEVENLIINFQNLDVAIIPVCPMDKDGFFNFGASNSANGTVAEKAKITIVEVNSSAPRCLGGNRESIHISNVDYIVESSSNPPLPSIPDLPISEIDRKIASLIMEEMEDGACLQLGIGGMPNAVGAMIADSDLKDLGVHTEMMCDAYVDLFEAGKITNRKKTLDYGRMVYTFALGSQKLYDFLNDNPVCASYPPSYTNDPYNIARNDKAFAINNCLEVDLYSQVASDSNGSLQIAGGGGQPEFTFGAFKSKGGKAFIAMTSTAKMKDGTLVSRIRPTLSPGTVVSVPRAFVSYIATEYGIVNMKGKSTWERAEALINIAHPNFRDELVKEATKNRIWYRSNRSDA